MNSWYEDAALHAREVEQEAFELFCEEQGLDPELDSSRVEWDEWVRDHIEDRAERELEERQERMEMDARDRDW